MAQSKRGRLSNKEMKFILAEKDVQSAAQIAAKLGKTEEMVEKFIKRHDIRPEAKTAGTILEDFSSTPLYESLEAQFSKIELRYFEAEYKKLLSQFSGDQITPSEDKNIIEVITFDILIQRCMREHKNSIDRVNELQAKVEEIRAKYRGVEMPDTVQLNYTELQNVIVGLDKFINEVNKNVISLSGQKQKLEQSLKMTRDQRINKIQTTASFIDLIKEFKKLEKQDKESRYAELVRKATLREKNRLQSPHTYIDGSVDLPVLTPEIVSSDEESENADSISE